MSVRRTLATAAVGAAMVAMAATWKVWPALVPATGAVVGLRIDGRWVAPSADVAQLVGRRADALTARTIRVHEPRSGLTLERRLGDIGVTVDSTRVVDRASAVGRAGTWLRRADDLLRARRGEIDVPLSLLFDERHVFMELVALKDEIDRSPVSARYDVTRQEVSEGSPGYELDVHGALDAIRQAAERGAATVVLPTIEVAPTVTKELLADFRPREVLAEYETWFSRGGKDAPRALNIEVAASRLDGLVLGPGEVASFNEVVGPRTVARGFKESPQIYKGEMVKGVGGGTCQVSSTLHAAAVYAGLDIVARSPHSRPLGYIALGLDSTVVYPEVDLKVRNPWAFPVVIDTEVDANKITIRLLGERKPVSVTFSRETLKVYPFKRKVTVKHYLPEGEYVKKEKGIRGYTIRRRREIVGSDGQRRVEVSVDRYPPTAEHYWVPPSLDVETELPELPEGAETPSEDA